jgi:hypothetical protein
LMFALYTQNSVDWSHDSKQTSIYCMLTQNSTTAKGLHVLNPQWNAMRLNHSYPCLLLIWKLKAQGSWGTSPRSLLVSCRDWILNQPGPSNSSPDLKTLFCVCNL